ncbi:hemerythrin domain-containing protein [Roseateles sp. LYH14W]|uniref:Hemerythrin domain-containing protein n=1 Tax=Pelomonas parva TaxID=3299032 RepID=A0ABW7F3G6_9BURK
MTATRPDLYAHIHKALRLFMTDTLQQLGCIDVDDPLDLAAGLAQLDALLDAAKHHVEKENTFMHPAIEARRAGASAAIEAEHDEHLDTIATLRAEGAALRAMPSAAAAQRLYRRLAAFVAHNFEHMAVEESRHNQALWAAYSDDELLALHGRIMASIGPREMSDVLRWMIPALNPAERAMVIGGLPPAVQAPVLASARALLNDSAWAKLCRAVGQPSVPGLVAA